MHRCVLSGCFGLFVVLFAPASMAQEPPKATEKKDEISQKDVWKLAYTPTRIPDRVILTWNGDPATTQAVTWRTDTTVAEAKAQLAVSEGGPAFAGYGVKAPLHPEAVTTVPARTEPHTSDLFPSHYHSVTFTGLKPKTRYLYRVGDGRVWSEWFEFRTASDQPEPLSFIYFGDAQNDLKSHWSRVIRGAFTDMPKANFILHAGDLINRANADGEWGEWHEAAGWINGMIPSIPTPGNHEYFAPTGSPSSMDMDPKEVRKNRISTHWRPQFTLPENGLLGLEESVYFLDIQGVRVISLNSNERQEEQVPWLENVLANNPNRWTIITFHHPIYSTARGRDNKKLRELWRPIFDKYTPDLILQGHDHTYGRSGPMREDNVLTGARLQNERGTVYCVSVSGPKMYTLEPAEWMVSSAADTQLYQLITIDGDVLRYEARTANGILHDSFELRKSPATIAETPASSFTLGTPAWVAIGVFAGVVLTVVGRRVLGKLTA